MKCCWHRPGLGFGRRPFCCRHCEMASFDDIRNHVLDDAAELAATTGLVAPLMEAMFVSDNDETLSFLRRLLIRHVALVVTRVHDRPGSGNVGAKASIEALLQEARAQGRISPDQFDHFDRRRKGLVERLNAEGVSYKELKDFRHAELAHSLQRHSQPERPLFFFPVWEFANYSFALVLEIDKCLVDGGAVSIARLDDEFHAWRDRGLVFWNSRQSPS
jgi:hypothetical protein